jgi:hypothetical protein
MSEELKAALLNPQAMDDYLELRTGQQIIDDIQAALASLHAEIERLNKRNFVISSNRNSFM